MGERSFFSVLYTGIGVAVLVWYLAIETRGTVFGGTDSKFVPSASSSSGSSGGGFGGGVIRSSSGRGFSSGFHGGK